MAHKKWYRRGLYYIKRGKGKIPIVGRVDFGNLRRVEPFNRTFGFDRGHPVDRYYIENFLTDYAIDIYGRVLEIGDDQYTHQFGKERVTVSDVLDINPDNSVANLKVDLTRADILKSNCFDCIIFTQTLQYIYDLPAAIMTLHRILKPGGVLLGTFPGISQISRYDMNLWGEFWRFTDASIRQLFGGIFGFNNVSVQTYGNILAAVSFLYGLVSDDLTVKELDINDPDYQVLITVRAAKGY